MIYLIFTELELGRILHFGSENGITSDFSPFPSKAAALLYVMLHSQRPIGSVHVVQSFIKGHRKSGVISIKHSRDM